VASRECTACGATVTEGQPDPCIGFIPGVSAACCGHGGEVPAYVAFYRSDGSFIAWSDRAGFVHMTAEELSDAEANVTYL
jgi:hypothetical protein